MADKLPKNIETILLAMLSSSDTSIDTIISYVQNNCSQYNLSPKPLGMIFEKYAHPDNNGFSDYITISELINIHLGFKSTNGCQWARTNASFLGKKYHIERTQKNGSVYSVKLSGFNTDKIKQDRHINQNIKTALANKTCCILDIKSSTGMEIDHKNARYDTDMSNQSINDFQVMTKQVNDAKRQHCKKCLQTKKRYDAKRLGYSASFICGTEFSSVCIGCYWYDPHNFNKIISENFTKKAD